MQKKLAVIGALGSLMASAPALATNYFDVRLASGTYEVDDGVDRVEFDSAGLDLRGKAMVSESLFLRAELLSTTADEATLVGVGTADVDIDTTILRFGIGGMNRIGDNAAIYGAFEFGSAEFDVDGDTIDDDGFIISGGLHDLGETPFLWRVELGLVSFSDSDGSAFEFEVGYRVNETLALLLGAQAYSIEDDAEIEYTVPNGFLGLRFSF